MAKMWAKFDCENCNFENWLEVDPQELSSGNLILYCCQCGFVKGHANGTTQDDNGISCCTCVPWDGFERKETNGPIGPGKITDDSTLWGTGDKNRKEGMTGGLKRVDFMAEYGWDPLTTWCLSMPHARAQWKDFDTRCISKGHVIQDPPFPVIK